jgi:hypothetical protein
VESSSKIIEELVADPRRFHATGGYGRMLNLLRSGRAFAAVRMFLRDHPEIAGDVLWTVAQLDNVKAFASDAEKHLSSPDKATAAYATEIVLRGAQDAGPLLAALERLLVCDVAVCEHAVRTLAGEGLGRLIWILRTAGGAWRTLADELALGPIRRETIEGLVFHGSRAHQVVGLALVTLAYEQDASFADILKLSTEGWIQGYGEWLTGE